MAEVGVVPALRVPERVNCWLTAGLALLALHSGGIPDRSPQ